MSELIIIVDENNQEIGTKLRADVKRDNDIYRLGALWVTNSLGQILIAQRKLTKANDPGMWGPAVAGTVEAGETFDQNIYKETEEEIGITGIELQKGPMMKVNEPRRYFCQWYTAVIDKDLSEFTPQESEEEQLMWIDQKELIKDVAENPAKYVPAFPQILELFT